MSTPPLPQVINLHWTGGYEKGLPENTVYIGRPSIDGNPFTHEGDETREEAVARHRIYLHSKLRRDPDFTKSMMERLSGHNLGCWCKNKHRFVCCHGDNILREINWLKQNNWSPGEQVTHGFGLLDEYKDLRAQLMLHIKEDNLVHALWDALITIDHQIVILPELNAHRKLLFMLAYVVTHLNVAYELCKANDSPDLILYHLEYAEYHASSFPWKKRIKHPTPTQKRKSKRGRIHKKKTP